MPKIAMTLAIVFLAPAASVGAQALPQYVAYLDADKDGKITQEEWTRSKPAIFKKLDSNADGFVTENEALAFYSASAQAGAR